MACSYKNRFCEYKRALNCPHRSLRSAETLRICDSAVINHFTLTIALIYYTQ
jgi:hypothetical protein